MQPQQGPRFFLIKQIYMFVSPQLGGNAALGAWTFREELMKKYPKWFLFGKGSTELGGERP